MLYRRDFMDKNYIYLQDCQPTVDDRCHGNVVFYLQAFVRPSYPVGWQLEMPTFSAEEKFRVQSSGLAD